MIRLFYATATASTSAHLALREAGIPFEGHEVSWERGLNLAELKAVNPFEAVPTLIAEDGRVITQNPVILEYIADRAPAKKLLAPAGSPERREAMSWMVFASADFQRSFLPLGEAEEITGSPAAQEEIRAHQKARITECLDYIERHLSGRAYLVGDAYTVADVHLYCCLNWCEWFEVPFSGHPNVRAYRERIGARETVRQVMSAEGLL